VDREVGGVQGARGQGVVKCAEDEATKKNGFFASVQRLMPT